MEEEKTTNSDAIETEPVEKTVEAVEETPVEEPVAEAEKEAAVEETIVEEPVVEAEKSEEAAVEEPEEAPVEKDLDARMGAVEEGLKAITGAIEALTQTVKALTEAPQAEEQVEGEPEGDAKVEPVEEEKSLETEAEEQEPGAPADRKGALPETELPDEGEVKKSPEPMKDLRQALSKYFASRN